MCRSTLQPLCQGVFPVFSSGPVSRNLRRHFFDPNEVKYDCNRGSGRKLIAFVFYPVGRLDRIWPTLDRESAVGIKFSCVWVPGEAGNTPGDTLERDPTHSEARKTNSRQIRGKSSCERAECCFSTDRKSDCIRSGLRKKDEINRKINRKFGSHFTGIGR